MTLPSYTLVRSRRKTVALVVSPNASLVVRAPIRAPVAFIEQFILEKSRWIQKTIERIAARPKERTKEFITGERFLYLGEWYSLTITPEPRRRFLFENGFVISNLCQPRARDLFIKWYKKEAKRLIPERVQAWAEKCGLQYRSVKINSATRRWGSCGPQNDLNFTWRLMMAPLEVIDYVVVHELAHVVHKNHSPAFWRAVEKMDPTYEKAKQWLREKEGELRL